MKCEWLMMQSSYCTKFIDIGPPLEVNNFYFDINSTADQNLNSSIKLDAEKIIFTLLTLIFIFLFIFLL